MRGRRALSSTVRLMALGMGGVVLAVLVVLAIRADSAAPDASAWLTFLDIAVGLAFVAAGLTASGPAGQRALVAAVGAAWLLGSFVPEARALHQAVLAVALIAFPQGRIGGPGRWLLTGAAVLIGFGRFVQLVVAGLFAAIAALTVTQRSRDPVSRGYPAGAAAAVAVVLAGSWMTSRLQTSAGSPKLALVTYEITLLLIAAAFPLATRRVLRSRTQLADRVLATERLTGLDGLASVLGRTLGDPRLQVFGWRASSAAYVDERGEPVDVGSDERRWLPIEGDDGPVAVVAHGSPALDDSPTSEAVSTAVRLAVTNLRLQEEERSYVRQVEASRARMLAAADRERERVAAELRNEVGAQLLLARSQLTVVSPRADGDAATTVVLQELTSTIDEIVALVAGVPPAQLGNGRLRPALHVLAERSPVPVLVDVAHDARGDAETEATLFYVCSEALTNAVKHAGASRVGITVRYRDGRLVTSISDDGAGGADPTGSGLLGLADRLATRQGRLRVESPPGAGTTVMAIVPVTRSSATA